MWTVKVDKKYYSRPDNLEGSSGTQYRDQKQMNPKQSPQKQKWPTKQQQQQQKLQHCNL